MFVGKAGTYPSEAPFKGYTLGQASDLTHKYHTRLERPASDKHSNLIQIFVNYGRIKAYNNGL
jgi:hypothetical protein